MFFELMIEQVRTACATFVDIDPQTEDRAIRAGLRAREHYADQITVKFANQTLKGVIDPEARKWFDIGAEMVDIIGGLPKRDERDFGRAAEAFDILLGTAKAQNKMVHVHVDQFNLSSEYETEMLAHKAIEHDMCGRVVAIHGISIGAHSRMYRQRLYTLLKEAGVMMVSCPTAWIDTARTEMIGPMHNSMTPVDELVPAGVTVALGTDNVCDAMVPWSAGDMWHELQLLATERTSMISNSLSISPLSTAARFSALVKGESIMKFKPSYTSGIAEDIMAERLIRAQAVEFLADAPMRLKSGLISPVYVDNRKLFSHPEAWRDIVETMASRVEEYDLEFDIVAGVEAAGSMHAARPCLSSRFARHHGAPEGQDLRQPLPH